MRFLNDRPPYDLTYSDVFMVPSLSSVPSRFDVDLTTPDRLGTTIPVVVVEHDRGRRTADGRDGRPSRRPHRAAAGHPARRASRRVIDYVKSRHTVYDTPITLGPHHTVGDALGLIHKRAHGAVIVVDDDGGRSASSPSTTPPASTGSRSCRT